MRLTNPILEGMTSVKRALISDIHGNLEALQAVLADIKEQNVDEIYCLGDIIGYGPNPCECLDLVMKNCQVTILGNHDQAALFDPEGFNPVALQAIYWTRDQLDRGPGSSDVVNGRWDFLGELPTFKSDGEFMYVHGSPRDPTNEYVFPEYVYDQRKLEILFGKVERYCFMGHTHLPGVFTSHAEFLTPEDCNYEFPLGDEKILVNVGSVGQPRDDNPLSCYTIVNTIDRMIRFRRIPYDFNITADKIYNEIDLPNQLGDRIKQGR
ncbi:diadenosine tetraphosphatase [Roseimaritima multifibrata]|uniref:Diadenosine tetraphosphatase n=1 Tax=Roseimaritima multifibrata TaxID=1930274 RepID=A0A517MEK6_9BACT|nr:diadenosine tetraphosphatase [Roseimaritima multifibrata]